MNAIVFEKIFYDFSNNGICPFIGTRTDLSGISLITLLSADAQISHVKVCPGPDRERMNFPCTNAAFTLSPEPVGFVVLCQLARGLILPRAFCSPDQVRARLWLARLPSGFLQTPPRGDALAFGSYFC